MADSAEIRRFRAGFRKKQKRDNVIRLAFGGDAERFDTFCRTLEEFVPAGTMVILRGSAVTGERWKDGAPFDADGPGTSDLDVTMVGDGGVLYFIATGFFVPGVHSRPLSDEDPDIAPDLVPLREAVDGHGRSGPVNLQASRDIVIRFRGDLLDQPYLTLFTKAPGLCAEQPPHDMTFRLLTYNILHGGGDRVEAIAEVINACAPDLVLLQEATDPANVEQHRRAVGHGGLSIAFARQSLGFMSREPVAFCEWVRPRVSRHAFIEVVPAGERVRVFGVHLSAVHAAWTEQRRVYELRALLRSIDQHRDRFHVLAGDFNTIAPGVALKAAQLAAALPAVDVADRRPRAMAHHPDRARCRLRRCVPDAASGRSPA